MFINDGLMQLNSFQVLTTAVHPLILIAIYCPTHTVQTFSKIGNDKCAQFWKFAL